MGVESANPWGALSSRPIYAIRGFTEQEWNKLPNKFLGILHRTHLALFMYLPNALRISLELATRVVEGGQIIVGRGEKTSVFKNFSHVEEVINFWFQLMSFWFSGFLGHCFYFLFRFFTSTFLRSLKYSRAHTRVPQNVLKIWSNVATFFVEYRIIGWQMTHKQTLFSVIEGELINCDYKH